jgi:hypothetical protein
MLLNSINKLGLRNVAIYIVTCRMVHTTNDGF